MWSKQLLRRFRQSKKTPQTQASQGFAAFHLTPSRIPPRHSQSKRATNCANPGFLVIEFCARCGQTCGQVVFLTTSACGGSACIAGVSRDCGHGIFQLEGGAPRSQSKRATNCANPGYEIQTDPTAGCSNSRVCLQNDYTTEPDRSTRGLPQKDGMQTKGYPLFY